MATFKGFAMKKIGETGWVEKEVPECGPMDAIVRPTCVSPCTSDIHTVWEGAIGERTDMVLGHEAVGVVEEVGSLVQNIKVGDKVIVPAITPDWDDEAAQRGYPSQTTEPLSNFKDGVFGERFHVNMADANLALMPEGLSDEAAVMLVDMWSTGMMGSENANIPLGGSVLVIGIGAVGLSAIAGAAILGAGEIYAAGTRPISVEVAKKYGATDIINYREGAIDEQVRELTDGAGVDSVIVAGGNLENTWKEAIASAKAGGTVSNVNYLSGADNVLIPRVEWGCGMSNINITNGTHKFNGIDKIEDALYLMKDKPKDLIKPVVILDDIE